MAVEGKENIIESLRAAKLVYWKIFEDVAKKGTGSFVATADFENPNLGEKQSYDELKSALNRLTRGRYIMTAYKTNTTKGGSAYDSYIETEGNGSVAGIGSTSAAEFYLEGIGKVTGENFEEAINKKIEMHQAKLQREKEDRELRDRVKQLEAEAKEADSAINKGLMAIGTVLYTQVNKSPAFAEVVSLVSGIAKAANGSPAAAAQPAQHLGAAQPAENKELPANHVEGDEAEIGGVKVNQDELLKTLDELGTNNPDVLDHLKILAKLKKDNPAMYTQAVDMASTL